MFLNIFSAKFDRLFKQCNQIVLLFSPFYRKNNQNEQLNQKTKHENHYFITVSIY